MSALTPPALTPPAHALVASAAEHPVSVHPRSLDVQGVNVFYREAGPAEAFKRDNPNAEVRLLDTGHFAIETHGDEIGTAMLEFLNRNVKR